MENKNLFINNSDNSQANEQILSNFINVYPNPSNGSIYVVYSVPDGISSTLTFYDVNGKQIIIHNLKPGSNQLFLNDEALFSSGVYHYTLKIGEDVIFRDKLVIIK